jgi:hypothetical protein
MKARIALLMGGAALSSILAAGCGDDNRGADMRPPVTPPPAAPPPSKTTDLDTADVLFIVQTETSDTAEPFQVDGGAIALVPAGDETGAPISVDAT